MRKVKAKNLDFTRRQSYHYRAGAAVGEHNRGNAFHSECAAELFKPGAHFMEMMEKLDEIEAYQKEFKSSFECKAARVHKFKAKTRAEAQAEKSEPEHYRSGMALEFDHSKQPQKQSKTGLQSRRRKIATGSGNSRRRKKDTTANSTPDLFGMEG